MAPVPSTPAPRASFTEDGMRGGLVVGWPASRPGYSWQAAPGVMVRRLGAIAGTVRSEMTWPSS